MCKEVESDSGNLKIKVDFSKSDPLEQVPVFDYLKKKPIEQYLAELVQVQTELDSELSFLDNLIDEICSTTYKINDEGERQRAQQNFFERILKNVSLIKKKTKVCEIIEPLHVTITKKVVDWELRNKPSSAFHKGTAFYWMAVFYLCQRNFDSAFNHFAQAINEDKIKDKTNYMTQGGYLTSSLIDTGHFAVSLITPTVDELKSQISKYQKKFNSNYSYKDLKNDFLLNLDPKIEILKFYFTRTFSNLCDFIINYEKYLFSENPLISSTLMHYLFGLSVIFEKLLRLKWTLRRTYQKETLNDFVLDVCVAANWTTQHTIDSINGLYKNWDNNSTLVDELLNLSFSSVTISGIFTDEARLLVANKTLRNLGAHTITDSPLIAKKYKEFLSLICYGIFLILDKIQKIP